MIRVDVSVDQMRNRHAFGSSKSLVGLSILFVSIYDSALT
jgi:hypothetical protein